MVCDLNFLRETKLYLVYNGNRYQIDTYPSIEFTQTFSADSRSVKTLHNQRNLFERISVTKANPANFSFEMPLLTESDLSVVVDLLVDYNTSDTVNTFDLYFESTKDIIKLETCVITSGVFNIQRGKELTLSISGQAAKQTRIGATGSYSYPGAFQTRSGTRTYVIPTILEVTANTTVLQYVQQVSVEVQNNIDWVEWANIHDSLGVTDETNTMYPEKFALRSRSLAGTVVTLVDNTVIPGHQYWELDVPMRIRTGEGSYFADFNMSQASITARESAGSSFFVQSYDYRMTESPNDLGSIITIY